LDEWERVKKDNPTVIRKSQLFGVENLTLSTPDGNIIFDKVSFNIPIGKSIVLKGPSGIGKTTLFRSVAKLWPYVEGKIIFPSEKPEITIYYIPQQAYFPLKSTLLEAICYPYQPTKEKKEKIIILMRELGFKKETICHLEKKVDKWNNQLSQGEQQRVAIIGAIIHVPDVLLMDEGTNGLDLKTKQMCGKMIREKLPHATIISIDHHAVPYKNFQPLFDYQIKMKPSHTYQNTLPGDERRATIRVKACAS